jgi:hypothetical protein
MNDLRDFRGPLPLTDADFARIRANVLAEVRPRRRPFFAFRFAFAAMAAVFAVAISWNALRVPVLELAPPAQPHPHLALTIDIPPLPAAAEERRVEPPRRPTAEAVAAPRISQPTDAQPVRLEIQTDDPDIRIIWLPNEPLEDHS